MIEERNRARLYKTLFKLPPIEVLGVATLLGIKVMEPKIEGEDERRPRDSEEVVAELYAKIEAMSNKDIQALRKLIRLGSTVR